LWRFATFAVGDLARALQRRGAAERRGPAEMKGVEKERGRTLSFPFIFSLRGLGVLRRLGGGVLLCLRACGLQVGTTSF